MSRLRQALGRAADLLGYPLVHLAFYGGLGLALLALAVWLIDPPPQELPPLGAEPLPPSGSAP